MNEFHRLLIRADSAMRKTVLASALTKGMSSGQPKLLEYLYMRGACDQKTIANNCGIEPATAGTVLMRMEEYGLIRRKRSEADRRSIIVELTDLGLRAAETAIDIFREADRRALKGIDQKDIGTACAVLKKIYENLCCDKENIK